MFLFLSYHEPPEISIYFKFVFITQTQNTVFGTFFRICPFVVSIKKVNKSDEEKEKFFVQLGASVEIFFPNKKPEELSDSLILWTTPEGKITDAEYSYEEPENEQFVQMPVPEKDLKAFVEAFKDFKLEFDSD